MTNAQTLEGPFQLSAAPSEPELLAKYFRVLADERRLRILELLSAEGEVPVGEVARRLQLSQPNVSNHLACLRWCGFVVARRDHRSVYNRIADPRVERLIKLARQILEDNEEHVASCQRT